VTAVAGPGRRVLAAGLLLTALGGAVPAAAQDSILVQVGGELAAPLGQYFEVPITVDMRGAPGRTLGSYTARVSWPAGVLSFNNVLPGSFAFPTYNADSAYSYGVLRLIAAQPSGADSVVQLFRLQFYLSGTTPGDIIIEITEMTAASTFEDLLPLVRIRNGTFCEALGRWGDVDADQQVGSRDALVALSSVVGLPIDPLFNASLADVDADGRVTSRDALIILSYAVGLDVSGFRLGLTASACGTATGLTLRLRPDSLELQSGQQAQFIVEGFDADGRPISTADVQFSTSNSNVAGVEDGYIVGREPGVATISATLGPGITASMEVTVLARRQVWYVDILNADPVTQTGSARHPFAFIGDALAYYNRAARDGDTVMVAPGTYEEIVSEDVSVTLLGDAVNRPIIDARGAPYFGGGTVLYLGTRAAPVEIRNFVIRGGGIYVDGASILVRNVDVDAPVVDYYPAIEFYGEPLVLPGAPGGAARTPPTEDLGNAVIDSVTVTGDFGTGIDIYQADSVFINNVTISRDTVGGSCTAYRYGDGGIMVDYAWFAEVRDNVITKARCTGIGVFVERGRAVISRNRINGVAGTGVLASAPVIALDHNVVRDVAADYFYYYEREGIRIDNDYDVDSMVSVGDSVVNVVSYYPYGIRVDTAGTAVVDSLVLDGVGQDSSFYGIGVQFQWAKSSLTNSRILNNKSDVAVASCGTGGVLRSRGNYISSSRGPAISAYDCLYYYTGIPDSLFSTLDTILSPLTAEPGVYAQSGVDYVRVDSAEFEGASLLSAGGVHVDAVGRVVVRDSRIREWYYGIYANAAADAEITRNTLIADSVGVDLNGVLDTVTIFGVTIDSSGYDGIMLVNGVVALLDSSLVSNSGQSGLVFHVSSSASVTRTRFQSNAVYGVLIDSDGGIVNPSVTQSTLSGNGVGGAANLAVGATLDAVNNYWGDPLGPRCDVAVTGVSCDPASTGDSVTTANVTFTPFLGSPPVTPAPPVMALASGTASSALRRSVPRAGSPTASTYRLSPPARLPEFSPAPNGPRGPRPQPPSWQKGRQPRQPGPTAN
jgi:hypothetical protein